MDLLEIVMLLIGILMIILSCTLIKEPEKKGETGSYEINTKDNIFSQDRIRPNTNSIIPINYP